MGRTVIIAQARMSSNRLPGKTLADLGGRPLVDHVISRARASQLADEVAVATTTDASDDILAAHLIGSDIPFVRGSLDDVLERYASAATVFRADTVVRITCDCPLIDPAVIDATIAAFRNAPEVDYCSNTLKRTYPLGMDTEVFSRAALVRADIEATQPHEREHVTPYLYQHPELFALRNSEAMDWETWPDLRLTVDEPMDLEMMRALVARISLNAGLREILDALRAEPLIAAINEQVVHRHVDKPESW